MTCSGYFNAMSSHKRIMILLSIPKTSYISDENRYSSIIKKIPDSNFSYNVNKLIEAGLVERVSNHFILTKRGRDAVELIDTATYDASRYFKAMSVHRRIMIILSIPRTIEITDDNRYSSIIKRVPNDANFSANMKKLIESGLVAKKSNYFILTRRGNSAVELINRLRNS